MNNNRLLALHSKPADNYMIDIVWEVSSYMARFLNLVWLACREKEASLAEAFNL